MIKKQALCSLNVDKAKGIGLYIAIRSIIGWIVTMIYKLMRGYIMYFLAFMLYSLNVAMAFAFLSSLYGDFMKVNSYVTS